MLDLFLRWAPVVMAALGTIVIPAAGWAIRRGLASSQDLATHRGAIDREIASIRQELHEIDKRLTVMPTREQIGALTRSLDALAGELKVQNARIDGMKGLIERTETTLLRHEQIFSDAARRRGE